MMSNKHVISVIALLALVNVGCATTSASIPDRTVYSIACDDISDYASTSADEKYVVRFLNSKDVDLDVFWINYDGEQELYGSIAPGETWSQNTFFTHPWVFRDKTGLCVAAYNSSSDTLVTIQ